MKRRTENERRVFRRCILIGVCVTAIVVALELAGLLIPLEYFLYDRAAKDFQSHSAMRDTQVVHIDIDDASIRDIGRWPWKRKVLADVVNELTLAGPKVVGMDILLDEPADT